MANEKSTASVTPPCLIVLALAFLSFIGPLKFSNPVIIREKSDIDSSLIHGVFDLIYGRWPNAWFYITLLIVSSYGVLRWVRGGERRPISSYIFWVPLIFLLIQFCSAAGTLHVDLTKAVLMLLISVVAGFYLGAGFIRHENHLQWILLAWCFASIFVISRGLEQAFGGLEQTRQFYLEHPEFSNPELWRKLQSDRIFSTFAYPNALGGFIISSVFLVAGYSILMGRIHPSRKNFFYAIGLLVIGLLCFCLWKSQSKGSYVCLFLTVLLGLTLLVKDRRSVVLTGMAVLVIFLGIFVMAYGNQAIEKAKKSGEARTAYWKAAIEIGKEYPLLGSGPGTFSVLYPKYKNPEDEDTRLVHNNYLQMWSDSGALGFISFALFLPGILILSGIKLKRSGKSVVRVSVWCACAAFALHSLIDFDLYMLSNAWPIFLLLGALTHPSE